MFVDDLNELETRQELREAWKRWTYSMTKPVEEQAQMDIDDLTAHLEVLTA